MTSHEPFCDQRHPPRQRCNDALRDAPAMASAPEAEPRPTLPEAEAVAAAPEAEEVAPAETPSSASMPAMDEGPAAEPVPEPAEPDEAPEPVFASAAPVSHPAGETNGAAAATPLAETLRTTTLAGAEWQKSLASIEGAGADAPPPAAAAPARRVPRKAIALAGLLASAAVLAAVMQRSRARRAASD